MTDLEWFSWRPEAFEKAKAENKLILLFISYAACHWGRKLERESFAHPDFIAAARARFILVRADRDIHPDVDFVFLTAAMAIRKSGNWPNVMILTPDMDPVISSGYMGGGDLARLMNEVDTLWKKSERELRAHAGHTGRVIRIHLETSAPSGQAPEPDLEKVRGAMDLKAGGFATGSKFPMTGILEFLLTEGSDDGFLILTLEKMARGGMFDHVNGGFFRCVLDAGWERPQFEKLLCDSALLASLFSRAALIFKNEEYEYTARRTLEFIKRDLSMAEGGLNSSIAAVDGEEGGAYTWTYDEALRIAGAPEFLLRHGVTRDGGMFSALPGDNGLIRPVHAGKNLIRRHGVERDARILDAFGASRRGQNGLTADGKVICAWHGMAISAFVRAAVAFGDDGYLAFAEGAGEFALSRLGKSRFYADGAALGRANLEDGAYLAMAYWDLFEATGQGKWLAACREMVDYSKQNFAAGDGGYYLSFPLDGLIARPRNYEDQPNPSPAAVLARVDLRLSAALGQTRREADSVKTAVNLMASLKGGGILGGEAMSLHREVFSNPMEIIYSPAKGERNPLGMLAAGYRRRWGAIRIPLGAEGMNPALSFGKAPGEAPRAFVCHDGSCEAPATSPRELEEVLSRVELDENES